MEIRLIAKPNNVYAEFYLNGIETHILNALRRAILTEVPTLAIHDVIVHVNTSVLYDEELALRLALIPLKADPSEIDVLKKCRDIEKMRLDELVQCTARLRLSKKNEGDDEIITVFSSDIEPVDKKMVRPVFDNIPIVKLGPGQEIDIEMIARVGKGKDHAKWMPVSTLGYKPIPKIRINDPSLCEECYECTRACPKAVLKKKDDTPTLEGLGVYLCDLDRICVRACPHENLILEPSETEFIFRIESIGQHEIPDIIMSAIDILEAKCDDFLSILKESIRKFKME